MHPLVEVIAANGLVASSASTAVALRDDCDVSLYGNNFTAIRDADAETSHRSELTGNHVLPIEFDWDFS